LQAGRRTARPGDAVKFDIAVQRLVDAQVEFVLIGGWAAILNGSSRTTRDLDICFARTAENRRRLAAALGPYNPRPRDFAAELPFVWDAATLDHGTVFTLTTTLGSIDILAEVSGLGSFDQVRKVSKLVEAFGRQVWTLDLNGLILAKRAAGRPKDLEALLELESIRDALKD
jgi:hypothetical protein